MGIVKIDIEILSTFSLPFRISGELPFLADREQWKLELGLASLVIQNTFDTLAGTSRAKIILIAQSKEFFDKRTYLLGQGRIDYRMFLESPNQADAAPRPARLGDHQLQGNQIRMELNFMSTQERGTEPSGEIIIPISDSRHWLSKIIRV